MPVDYKEAGMALLKQGRYAEAVAELKEAVAEDDNDETAWRLLGGALASKGDPESAVMAFQKAARLLPKSARSHYNLGLAQQASGQLSEARASLEKALALDPTHEASRQRLGEIAQKIADARGVSASPTGSSGEGHTNIGGGGDTSGLSSVRSSTFARQNQPEESSDGHTNIGGGGNTIGLASIGASVAAVPESGHSNIGGGSATGLSSVGSARPSSPQETGHTNIGGGNTTMLGGIGPAARSQPTIPSPASVTPVPPPAMPPPASVLSANANRARADIPAGAPPPQLGLNYNNDGVNTSGSGEDAPYDVAKPWNWGAFFLTLSDIGYFWAFNMRLPLYGALSLGISVLTLILVGVAVAGSVSQPQQLGTIRLASNLMSAVGFGRLGLAIWLGMRGNQLAWKHRSFADSEDFHRCQRTWTAWGIGIFVGTIVVVTFVVVLFAAAAAMVLSGGLTPGRK